VPVDPRVEGNDIKGIG